MSEGQIWECQLNPKTHIRVESRGQYLLLNQTGKPESIEEAKELTATVTEAVRASQLPDIICDNRESEAPRGPLLQILQSYFVKDGPLRDVAMILDSPSHRLRINAAANGSAAINSRAFSSFEEAEHWLTGWRDWEEHGVCLFVFDGRLYGSDAADIAEVVAYSEPTEIPGAKGEVLGVVAFDSTLFRVLASPGDPSQGDEPPSRLLLGRKSRVALPAHQTPFVGTLRICDSLEHGKELRSSVGNFTWVDFATLEKRSQGSEQQS